MSFLLNKNRTLAPDPVYTDIRFTQMNPAYRKHIRNQLIKWFSHGKQCSRQRFLKQRRTAETEPGSFDLEIQVTDRRHDKLRGKVLHRRRFYGTGINVLLGIGQARGLQVSNLDL